MPEPCARAFSIFRLYARQQLFRAGPTVHIWHVSGHHELANTQPLADAPKLLPHFPHRSPYVMGQRLLNAPALLPRERIHVQLSCRPQGRELAGRLRECLGIGLR